MNEQEQIDILKSIRHKEKTARGALQEQGLEIRKLKAANQLGNNSWNAMADENAKLKAELAAQQQRIVNLEAVLAADRILIQSLRASQPAPAAAKEDT